MNRPIRAQLDEVTPETAERTTEGQYRLLFECNPHPMWVYDSETLGFLDVNHTAIQQYGYSRNEFLGMTIRDIGLSEDVPKKLSRHRKKDGTFIDVETRSKDIEYCGRPAQFVFVLDVSERLRAESEMLRTSSLLKAVADGTPDAVFVKDRAGRYLLFNDAAASFVGKPVEEVIGRDDTSLFDPAGAQLVMDYDRQVMELNRIVTYEEALTAAGVTRTYLATKAPYRDADGNVIGVIGISRDISERKRAEIALQQEREFVRLVLDTDPNLIFVKDADGRFVLVNKAIAEIYGTTPEALVGRHAGEGFPDPAEFSEYLRIEKTVLQTGTPAVLDEQNTRPDGRSYWFHTTKVPLVLPDGTTHVLGISLDITERKQAEDALRLRDRAIGAATQGLVITDPNQTDNPIIYVSPGFERITGYCPEEVIGRNCRFLQGKDTDPVAIHRVRDAIRVGATCTVELLNYKKDGTPFWNELSLSPVRDEARRLTHFVGVQADVTARRTLEEQFRQAQKMEAIGQLAGGVAHDFNNLLTIINGYSELLLQTLPATDPKREMIDEIHKAGERSAGLTRQLLAFSRQQLMVTRVLDLNEILASTDKMLRRLIGEDICLTTTLAANTWAVRADPGQIEQVLLNLAVNARDAMPLGGRLTIETQNVEIDAAYVRDHPDAHIGPHALLTVTDTGSGMLSDVRAKIFEPFFTTKGPGKGTGLGLATVYGIVKQSGGHIAIISQVGVGTTFRIYLPRVDKVGGGSKLLSGFQLPPKGTETVLLVEDEDGVRALTRHVLVECGYTVHEAANGEEAVRLAARHDGPIHLLITDVVMPGAGGRIVAEQMTASDPMMRVLFVSGHMDDAIIRHGVIREGVHFLQKPFSPVTLAIKVRDVLDAILIPNGSPG